MGSLDQQQSIYQSTYYFKKYVQDEIYKTDNYAEISLLLGLLNNASDQEFFASLPLILDMDNFLSWQAHSVLMSSIHQDSIHNIRLYWHPALGKFFIFPWDVLGGQVVWPVDYHPLVSRVLENPDWLQKRNKILSEYVNNPDNLTEDLEYYDEQVKKTKIAIFKDYKKFFSNLGYLKQTQKTRQQIINQFELIKKSIAENSIPNESSAFKFPLTEKIDVNHIDKPVDQSEFQYLDQSIKLPAKLNYSAGNHYINQTIIIPKGYKLTLQSGARLIFAPNTSLLSYSPVEANNVTITAQDSKKPWGVFALLGSDASQSTFNNILVEHGSEAIINGTYFSGALAIHQAANTKITNSTFRYNHGDDGLNIKYADANVVNNLFIQNDFDGFDLDFGSGQVLNNQFIKNGNDGLDLGSASPLIKDNLIDTAGDKCISLGETSSPKINQNILKNCNFGIAVKDSSQPIITDNQITNNHIGLASYVKKPIFERKPFAFANNQLLNNEIDYEEEDSSLRKQSL